MAWAVAALILFGARLIEGVSNGVALTCDVDNPMLGSAGRVKNTSLTMWWTLPPVFAGNQYTLATIDPPTATGAPTSYVNGQWMNIYVRTTYQDQQFTGIIMYAVNANGQKVGQWQPATMLSPFHARDNGLCVVHSNADPKNYLNVFKFKGPPAGTGKITIKALVKFGLAFPSMTGTFFWPNSAHLQLTEKAPSGGQVWFQGELGDSCITTCLKRGWGCDLPTMQSLGTKPTIGAIVAPFTNCSGPMLPGCSAYSPSVGETGCFYHDPACTQPPAASPWVRLDPCTNLSAYSGTTQYPTGSCCTFNNSKWCSAYYTSSDPSNSNPLYGAWAPNAIAPCKPAGGWPTGKASITIPARVNEGARGITCEATSTKPQDGYRICACSPNGQKVANAATSVAVSLAILLLPLFCAF